MTNKPDLSKVWAENADPTDIKNPDLDEAGKFQKGWITEIPPHTWFNYIQNNFSAALAHFNEYGVAQWDTDTVYPIGGWARSTVDNEVYAALVAQSGNEPSASPVQWKKYGSDFANQTEVDAGTEAAKAIAPDTFKGNLDDRGLWELTKQISTWDGVLSRDSGIYSSTPGSQSPPFGGDSEWLGVWAKRNVNSGIQLLSSREGTVAARGYLPNSWQKWKLLTPLVMHVRDEKPSGTNGGTALNGNNIRVLNTVVTNEISGASLSSNQITLPAGVYDIYARVPAQNVNGHRSALYNATDASYEVLGSCSRAFDSDNGANDSTINGRITISATKTFNIYHDCGQGEADKGLGQNVGDTRTEVYTDVIITQIAEA